ncbi:hypothetical protein GCM10010347_41890 [Streptomyces cirratus]|uniref:DUF6545 domain-containing protein n=1 Tax=Streptomyces cirratus TaxID=68187 RepID=A0ABQ3F353_9ACTN|nr:hypothetical protein GCM10010347_41890 [Streptomyces cirratus]
MPGEDPARTEARWLRFAVDTSHGSGYGDQPTDCGTALAGGRNPREEVDWLLRVAAHYRTRVRGRQRSAMCEPRGSSRQRDGRPARQWTAAGVSCGALRFTAPRRVPAVAGAGPRQARRAHSCASRR